jgi:ElaB/YqjD/DUF883 family membrane-anchored ribosome-binding protein
MDDKNKGLNERWAEPGVTPERGYASDVEPKRRGPGEPATSAGSHADPDTERRTREIRSEIERTREGMDETIGAIEDRLRPSNLVANAKETVRDATVGKVKQMASSARQRFAAGGDESRGAGVVGRIRENPVPAAIAAASLAWLAFGGRKQPRMSPAIYGSTREGEPYLRETVISEDVEDVTELGGYSTGTGYPARGDVDWGRSAPDTAGEATQRARAMARDTGTTVRRATSNAQTRLQRFVFENPLAAGAVAAAVGATVGLALPETRRENQLMGDARDAVVTRAQEAARGAAERVQDAAERVSDIAGEAAKSTTRDEA